MVNKNLNLLLEGKIESYWWNFISDDDKLTKYEFEDDVLGYKYLVEFKLISETDKSYELFYYVFDEEKNEWSVSILTGVNVYRTIRTVFGNILQDFLLKRKPFCKKLKIVGLAKTLERSYKSQRTKIYLRFLVKNPVPGFRTETFGNWINLIRI